MVKPGIRTTELLVTVATDVGLVAAALAGNLPPKWAAIATAVSSVGYSLSRGLTKNGAADTTTTAAAAATTTTPGG